MHRPFAEQERELLTELVTLFSHRAEQERALPARLEDGLAKARADHAAAVQRARREAEQGIDEAAARRDRQRETIETEHGPAIESATRAMEAELETFRERTQELADAIAAKRDEARWLADTMYESGMGRIKTAFETARDSIGQRSTELNQIERSAASALELGGHRLPPAAEVDPQAPSGPTPAPLAEAIAEARRAAVALEAALRPKLVQPLSAGAIVVGALLIGAAAAASTAPSSAAITRGVLGAGGGVVVGLAIVLAARLALRSRVPPAAKALRRALDEARRSTAEALRAAAATRETDAGELKSRAAKDRAELDRRTAAQEAQITKRRREEQPALRARLQRGIDQHAAQRDTRLAQADAEFARIQAELEAARDAQVRAADAQLEQVRTTLEASTREGLAELERTWTTRLRAALEWADRLAAEGAALSPPWELGDALPLPSDPPPGVQIGRIRLDLTALPGGLPADPALAVPGPAVRALPVMIDLLGRGSVTLRAAPEERERALGILNNIVLRILTGLPPGKARFTIVDPVGLGQSFAGLMHLSDYEEAIVGERIWTDPRHIEQRLTDLTDHMETVIQKYLRNQYETIQAYNAEAGEMAEPYRFLVIADCPAAINEAAAKRLVSIATSGARCGVFLLVMTTQPAPRASEPGRRPAPTPPGAFPWPDLERHSLVLRLAGPEARWMEEPFSVWPVELEAPPAEAASTRLLQRVGELAKDSTRVQVPFQIVAPPDRKLWTESAASEIRLPLGRSGARKVQHLSLGRGTAQHALIAGRTGSGKSTLLHVIITTAGLWYSPDELELYLVDFKKGVEFKTYATHELPHARVVAVESEREFGLSVLRRLDAELTRRGAAFRDAGVQDLAAFRRWQNKTGDTGPMPRILLIVDEFQEFFVEDDKLAQDAGLLLDRLVRQGRAFGMHIVLGSQTLGGAYTLARSTLGQMAVRIALQCSEADSYLIMSEDNPAPRLLSRPGEAIYNDASGLIEGNSPFQIVWLPDEVRETYLRSVHDRAAADGRPRPQQVVFEGNIPGDLARNHGLETLAHRRAAPGPVPLLWLGEPLAIKEPTGVPLRQQSAANALIVGNQDEAGLAMLAAALLGFAAWRSAAGAEETPGPAVTLLDSTPLDIPHADLLPRAAQGLGPLVRSAGPRQAEAALDELVAEIQRREASGLASHPPRLLIINGLQRFRELRKSDDYSFSSEPSDKPTPAQRFMTILRSGPTVGIHTLVWCDTATNVERMLERSALREFNSRVLMQMSAGDSTNLIESPAASGLGRHRALLYSDDTGLVEKFRPYAVPDAAWLEALVARIAAR